ncbi:MAG: hypothetical protein ACRDZ3_20845 [Acidimicrobiia bacterium]
MFQKIHSIYGAVGVMLFLVAMYLVLTRAAGATSIISSLAAASGGTLRVLQGR